MEYALSYFGIGGIEAYATHRGDLTSLAEHVDYIESRGGSALTVTEVPSETVVYECGGFVVQEKQVVI